MVSSSAFPERAHSDGPTCEGTRESLDADLSEFPESSSTDLSERSARGLPPLRKRRRSHLGPSQRQGMVGGEHVRRAVSALIPEASDLHEQYVRGAPVVTTVPSVRVATTGADPARMPAASARGICGVDAPRNSLAQTNTDTVSLRPDLAGDDKRSIFGRVIEGAEIVGAIGGRNASSRTSTALPPRAPVVVVGSYDKPDTTKRTAATAASATTKPLNVARICDSAAFTGTRP